MSEDWLGSAPKSEGANSDAAVIPGPAASNLRRPGIAGSADTSRLLFPSLRFCIVDAFHFAVFLIESRYFRLQLLARRPEQDFVYVHVIRLAHGEDNRPRKRIGGDREALIELLDPCGGIPVRDVARQLGSDRAR